MDVGDLRLFGHGGKPGQFEFVARASLYQAVTDQLDDGGAAIIHDTAFSMALGDGFFVGRNGKITMTSVTEAFVGLFDDPEIVRTRGRGTNVRFGGLDDAIFGLQRLLGFPRDGHATVGL